MQINIQTKSVTVLELQGKVIGQDALVLKTMMEEQVQKLEGQEGIPLLIVDMARTQSIDSAGLGGLITVSTQIRQKGGTTALINVSKGIKRVFIRANLASLFEFPKNLAEAMTSNF